MSRAEEQPDPAANAADAPRVARATIAALVLLVVAGLGLRLHGIGFLAPHWMEPDGLVVDYQLRVIDGRGPESAESPFYAYYPHLVARVATLVPESWVAPSVPRTLEEHLDHAGRWRMRGRIAVAVLSLLAIPLSWWLARRFLPDPWPLVAAGLVAASPFTIWFAQQARPHAAHASFALLTTCAAVTLRRDGGWRAWTFAALAAGLAVGSLQNGVAALLPVGVAILYRIAADRTRALVRTGLVLVVLALAIVLLYPFLLGAGERGGVAVDGGGTLALSQHQIFLNLFNGRGFAVVWRSLEEYDPLLTAGALVGMLAALASILVARGRVPREHAADLWIVLAYALPYLVVIGLYQRTYQRFVLPLVPFLAILAAFGLWRVHAALRRRSRVAAAPVAALSVLLVAAQVAWSFRLGAVRSARDTVQQAAAWVVENVDPRTDPIDVMPGIDLPLARTRASIARETLLLDEQNLPWFRHLADPRRTPLDAVEYDVAWMDLITSDARQRAHADAYAFARSLTGRYAVVTVWPNRFRPAMRAVREGLLGQYERVARFVPDAVDEGEDLPLLHQDDELPYTIPWALRVLTARSTGPVIEIYRLR